MTMVVQLVNLAVLALVFVSIGVVVGLIVKKKFSRIDGEVCLKTEVNARVVTKRVVSNQPDDTAYYVTFELENGNGMEFLTNKVKYDMLSEGSTGKLVYKGSQYINFNS